ncbi:MAG: hflC [Gammaproteobacteria bacterium]|jgi:membrane protease subunit HflC|nr:hflC [Gammaproteobacteria bacterium]
MNFMKRSALFVIALILILLYVTMYTVEEGQRVMLTRLGQIVTTSNGKAKIVSPGLHFKVPFIYQVHDFDIRLQTLTSPQPSRVFTVEQKEMLVDYYMKWRISNLALYYQRTRGDTTKAQALLQQQMNDALRATFGQRTVTEVISGERVNIMSILTEIANDRAQDLGIDIADVRIKSIDWPQEVSESVYTRMRTDREKAAMKHRADGRANAEAVRAEADAKVTVTVAEAYTKAAALRAQGQGRASEIYTQAYDQDRDFYTFYRSLEAYGNVFNNKSDILFLTPESNFFKYFSNNLRGGAPSTSGN